MNVLDAISRRFGWRIFRIPRTTYVNGRLAVYYKRIP